MPNIFARIENGAVNEIITIEDNTPPLSSRYHASLLDHFVELHGPLQYTVKVGWNYDGSGFSNPPPPPAVAPPKRYIKVSIIRERMEELGKWDNLVNILSNDMPKLVKVLTLDLGIDPEDQEARGLIFAAGADPDEILKE